MLLEGEARESAADLVASGWDKAAEARVDLRVYRVMDLLRKAYVAIDEAARESGYEVTALERNAVALAIIKGMSIDGVEPILDLLKAQAILDGRAKGPDT